ncbi:MAG: site-2 protease family protein [Firmicutes bacterium]|nr:site-2 protease family protein [Bacillota bacterium]
MFNLFSSVWYIFLALLLLMLLVTVHELGHYLVGKLFKFKIDEFAVGFGPKIAQKKRKNGELITLRAIPLGGYCAFRDSTFDEPKPFPEYESDESESSESGDKLSRQGGGQNESSRQGESLSGSQIGHLGSSDSGKSGDIKNETEHSHKGSSYLDDKAKDNSSSLETTHLKDFTAQHPAKRIAVLSGGIIFNFIFAVILAFILLAGFGENLMVVRYELPVYNEAGTYQIGTASVNSETSGAYQAGLLEGDIIVAINGSNVHFFHGPNPYLNHLGRQIQRRLNRGYDNIPITVYRRGVGEITENVQIGTTVRTRTVYREGAGYISEEFTSPNSLGIFIGFERLNRGVWFAFTNAVAFCLKLAWFMLSLLGSIVTGVIGLSSIAGPVGTIGAISGVISDAVTHASIEVVISLAILISVNLAVFNALPVPALDGSRIIFTTIEWIRRKPIDRHVEAYIHFAGFLMLIGFVIFIDLFNALR